MVGADGRNSSVAKRVQAADTQSAPTITCWYFSYWSGVVGEGLELYRLDFDAFESLAAQLPRLGRAILLDMGRVLALRLRIAASPGRDVRP